MHTLHVRTWKIKYKLIAAMYVVLIPVLFGITTYIYVQSLHTVRGELSNAYKSLTRTIDFNIDYIESDIKDLITYVSINDDVRHVLNAPENSQMTSNPLIWQQETPAEFITEMLYVKDYIQGFAVYPENGVRPYMNARRNVVLNAKTDEIRDMEVFKISEEHQGDMAMMRMEADNQALIINNAETRVIFGKAVLSYSKEHMLGYICAVLDTQQFMRIFERDRLEENESIYLLDDKGNEVLHSGEANAEDLHKIAIEGKNWCENGSYGVTDTSYIFGSRNEEYDYSVYYIVPKENWKKQLKSASKVPFVIAITLFFASFPILNLVTRFITIPLGSLHASMLRLQEGDFKQEIPVYSEDEIGDVTRVYNGMVRNIDELINKNYAMVLRERESELDILQAQINPHFLYNTLDSLYWDAFNLGDMELAENIMALSELFRLALSRGKGIVTVETEFKLIESYLHIQKMRFEKRMDYRVNLLSDMKDMEIPKLILQPFVENAIVHGLENTSNTGFIDVHGFLEEAYMVFKISDNGVGMNEEQVQQVFMNEDNKQYSNQRISKYAIKNVRERLRLRYGEDFSLQINSTLGAGTTITIRLPLQMEGDRNV